MAAKLTTEQVLNALGEFSPEGAVELGSGSFGTTWRVSLRYEGQPELTTFAVKFIDPRIGRPWDVSREIDGMRSVEHENVLRLHDAIHVEIDGLRYVALLCDFMAGGDLAHALDRHGVPTVAEQLCLARGLARGLGALHQAGRYHRDLKPLNILLRDHTLARPVIGDFGQSRGSDDDTLTRPGEQLGTLAFRAPEVVADRSDYLQADVWSLGAILHCVATGHVPQKQADEVVVAPALGQLPDWYRSLIVEMIDGLPGFRPSMRIVTRTLETSGSGPRRG